MAHTTTHVPTPIPPTTDPPSRADRTRGGVAGWLLTAAGLAAAGVLLLVATSAGPPPSPAPIQSPNGSLIDMPHTGWPAGVPQSADAAERWFALQQAPVGWPEGIPRSADAADRWFNHQQ